MLDGLDASATSEVPHRVVVVLASDLTGGAAANVSACLASGLAASVPGWAGKALTDSTGFQTVASSHAPIAILRATPEAMQKLIQQLVSTPASEGCTICLFPKYAQTVHDALAYWEQHAASAHAQEELLGIALHGSKKLVNRFTGSLPLWR